MTVRQEDVLVLLKTIANLRIADITLERVQVLVRIIMDAQGRSVLTRVDGNVTVITEILDVVHVMTVTMTAAVMRGRHVVMMIVGVLQLNTAIQQISGVLDWMSLRV